MLDGHLLLGKIRVVNYLVHLGSFCCSRAGGPFDTHFVYFGHILPVSGMKTLVVGVKLK